VANSLSRRRFVAAAAALGAAPLVPSLIRTRRRPQPKPGPLPGTPVFELGISISGAEPVANDAQPSSQAFSNANVVLGSSYPFSYEYEGVTSTSTHNHRTWAYLASRGFKVVKIPTRWERLTKNAAALTPTTLDSAEMALLDTEITEAGSQGLKVVIDLHNYGQYYADGAQTGQGAAGTGFAQALGTTQHGFTWSTAFADFWAAMTSRYISNTTVIGFHLMNEPNATVGFADQTLANWKAASQSAVNSIRAVDTAGRLILRVGGFEYSSCRNWPAINSTPWITDPNSNTWYEAHHYWDPGGAGGNSTYATEVSTAVSRGYTNVYRGVTYPDALYSNVLDDIYQFSTWLPAGVKGVIGETSNPNQAWASAGDQVSWNSLLAVYLDYVGELGNLNVDMWMCGEKSWNNFAGNWNAVYASSNDTTTGVDTAGCYSATLETKLAQMR
jgi:Cellulase (glycosyl hydrolase family 5)